jgi:hypothetical protein
MQVKKKICTGVGIMSVAVKALAAVRAFYLDVPVCRVIEEMPRMPGSVWIRLEFPGVETRIVLANWFK